MEQELISLREQNAMLKEAVRILHPAEKQDVLQFVAMMAAKRETAKGQGITPIMWTMAIKGMASEKQVNAARNWANSDIIRFRTLEAVLNEDTDAIRIIDALN